MRTQLTSCLLLLGFISCQKNSEDLAAPLPPEGCRLQTISNTSAGGGYTSISSKTTYEYTAQNQLFRTVYTSTSKAPGSDGNSLSTVNYTYDSNGYVIQSKSEATYSYAGEYTDNIISQYTYSYKNGRLDKETTSTTYDRIYVSASKKETTTTSGTIQYEYDGEGRLTKITSVGNSSASGTSSSIQTFDKGKLIKRVYTSGSGPEIEDAVLNDGRIIQEKQGSTVVRFYKYDADNHLVRQESWENGKLFYYTEQTYDSQKSTFEATPQLFFPGWPREKSYDGARGNISNNVLLEKNIYIQANGTTLESGNTQTTYQFNTKGFTIKQTRTGKFNSVPYTSESTYTYITCN